MLRNQAQRLRQVLLHQSIPGLVGLALVQEDGRGRRVVAKVIVRRGEQCDVAGVEHESALGKTNGRRDQRAARTRAILFPSVFEPGYAARYAHGQVAFRARALDDIAGAIEVHVGRGRERRLFAKVEKCLAPIGQLDGGHVAYAIIAHAVELLVTVLFEHVDTHLGGKLMRRDHHAMFAANRCDRRGVRHGADNCRNCDDQAC